MNRPMGTFVSATLLIATIGCGQAFVVKKGTHKVAGVPFYLKQAVCLHQMVYVAPYYRISFQSLVAEKVQFSRTVTLSETGYRDTNTQKFLSIMRKKPPLSDPDFQSASEAWEEMEKVSATPYQGILAAVSPWPTYLVANSNVPKIYVDYASTYTLNAKVPFAGSVNAAYELNADGTLTKASSQVTEETFKTILGALPISDLIKTAAGAGIAANFVGAAPPTAVTIQAVVEPRALKVTYSQNADFTEGCADLKEFDTDEPKGVLIEDSGAEAPKDKGDENAIGVSGKITLPKSASGAADKGGSTKDDKGADSKPK
jgi:hypothetical protein